MAWHDAVALAQADRTEDRQADTEQQYSASGVSAPTRRERSDYIRQHGQGRQKDGQLTPRELMHVVGRRAPATASLMFSLARHCTAAARDEGAALMRTGRSSGIGRPVVVGKARHTLTSHTSHARRRACTPRARQSRPEDG